MQKRIPKATLNVDDQIIVENATQRTISILGGKGAGKTTLIKMLMRRCSPVLCFDPLNVIGEEDLEGVKVEFYKKDIDEIRVAKVMKFINELLRQGKNVVLSFVNMIQEEEIALADMIIPKITLKDGFVFVDEVHEFVPIHSQSLEMERFCRHCRNRNIGFLMTSQRAAAVNKNALALTDYLIVLRTTWTHDLKAINDLLTPIMPKEEVGNVMSNLPACEFLEGYTVDYRSEEAKL